MSKVRIDLENLEAVLERAAKLVTPDESEAKKLDSVTAKIRSRIEKVLTGIPEAERPEITLGGSYAKGTWLKGSHDIDFFLQYPKEYPREKLESDALESAKAAVREYGEKIRYAEHPYVESFVEGVRVNIVPCYKVARGEWQSAADRSPYHAEFIKSKFDERLKLEARLFKKFAKAIGVYGAEVKIQGFSGYVCEVLVLNFGSFQKALEGLGAVKQGEVISPEPYDKVLVTLFKSPLIILDPVDTTRNLGAAISQRNIAKLALESRRFLAMPSLSHLTGARKRPKVAKAAKNLLERTLVVEFRNKSRSPDILWGQLKKSAGAISNKLESLGFKVLRFGSASDEDTKSALLFLLLERKIGRLQLRQGPEYFRSEEVEHYLAKNAKISLLSYFGDDGRLYSIKGRSDDSIDALVVLAELIKKKRDKLGISKEIQDEIKKGLKVETGTACFNRYHNPEHWLGGELLRLVSEE
jgi:tRNA nucleotidyltransferase (CCA-adding enzyme)